ncbi:MAG: M16 family metallopeptidase [Tepidisphaeraceae bacterium]
MSQAFFVHRLSNGLTLVAEKMAGVRSAAMTLLVPAGASGDPVGRLGTATVLAEMVLRGAGARDSKELTDHLDTLGLQRSSSAAVLHARFSAAALAPRVLDGLDAYADILRRARLEEADFDPTRDLALQSLSGIDDEPRQKLFIKLRENFWPWPFGRNPMGEKADLEALTIEEVRQTYAARYSPENAILAVAGDIDFAAWKDRTEALFADWNPQPASMPEARETRRRYVFEPQQSEQTHIGLAYGSVDENHPDYYPARLAVEVLSGGMSGRLFTEIREKKGLVYNVSASYASLPGIGAIMGYAGTSNERAQQTLDQFLIELDRLSDGVTEEELQRAKTGLKSSSIMSGESTGSRAGSIAHDFFIRGRLRTIDEITAAIDAVNVDRVNAYLKENRPANHTIVIVGPKELKLPH